MLLGCIADDFTGATDLANNLVRSGMLERMTPNAWGADPAGTMATLKEFEEAGNFCLACAGCCAPLDPAQIEELRIAFGASW